MNEYVICIEDSPTCMCVHDECVEMDTESSGVMGTYDHDELDNRELPDQHPIGAVTGLNHELDIRPSEAISDAEIWLLD